MVRAVLRELKVRKCDLFVCLFVCLTTSWSRLRTIGIMKTGIVG